MPPVLGRGANFFKGTADCGEVLRGTGSSSPSSRFRASGTPKWNQARDLPRTERSERP